MIKMLLPFTVFLTALGLAPNSFAQQTETSTGFKMPEDGGPLPRAPMPTGGVEDPFKRRTPEGGTGRDMKNVEHCHQHTHRDGKVHEHCHGHNRGAAHEHPHKGEHCHEHEHKDGTVHSHCHDKGKNGHDHPHGKNEHCHQHEHEGGKAHEHCHDHTKGKSHKHEHGKDEHCHDHEHGGKEHGHCHNHAAGPEHSHTHGAAGEKHCHGPTGTEDCHVHEGEAAHTHGKNIDEGEDCHEHVVDGRSTSHCHKGGQVAHAHGDPRGLDMGFLGPHGLRFSLDGYLRVLAEVTENDPQSTFIGRNDGFRLGRVRLGTRVAYRDFTAYISLEAAVGEVDGFNNPNQEFAVRPRDAYLNYDFSKYASVRIGRFRSPYDLMQIKPAADRVFIDTPVYSRGVLATQGNQVLGMSQDRQLGLAIFSEKVGLSKDGFDLAYSLALTNGRTFNLALNDNDQPAGFLRLSLLYSDWLSFNVAGFTDTQTVGELPNLFDEEVKGMESSFSVKFFGVYIETQVLFQNRVFETSGVQDVNSLGWHVQATYTFWGIWGGYRLAFFDPNLDDIDDADAVLEHTIVLGYQVPDFPLLFTAQGTIANEQTGRKLNNNRLTFLAQFRF